MGDYFEQWGRGAQAQIEAAGGKVTSFDARGDNGRQVTQFNDAIAAKPNVIIVDHGLADSVNPKIDEAIGQGIPVVVYDVNISNCKATYISQDDESIATKILDYMKQDNPSGGKIAYVNVSGIAPLDSRDAVYQEFLKANPSFTQVARFGKYSESVAADTAAEGAAALEGGAGHHAGLRRLRRAGQGHPDRPAAEQHRGQGEGVRRGRLHRGHPADDRAGQHLAGHRGDRPGQRRARSWRGWRSPPEPGWARRRS